jgi:hypothetical protein
MLVPIFLDEFVALATVAVLVLVHSPVFYVRPLPATPFLSSVVGWLTTGSPDLVDASGSRCHYQKREQ